MKSSTMGMTAASIVVSLLGCGASQKPQALTAANEVYANAETNGAQKYAPNQLEDARRAIDTAESAFNEEPEEQRTEDLSYIAHRRALIAQYSASDAKLKGVSKSGTNAQNALKEQRTDKLEQTVQNQAKTLEQTRTALQMSEAERKAAVLAAEQARADLARIAATKETPESIVLTIQGAVLFKSNEATLAPAATEKLRQVAAVLMRNDQDGIVVVGHTDSRGNDDSNQVLSQKRAQAVVDYFVSQGVTTSRIEARGMGEAQPVAENESTEGRANNRRVEIVIPKQDLNAQ